MLMQVSCAVISLIAVATPGFRALAETEQPVSGARPAIAISADFAQSWHQDQDSVVMLRGRCEIVQGATTLHANKMVIWRRTDSQKLPVKEKLVIYLEDDVRVEEPGSTRTERTLVVDLSTRGGVTLDAPRTISDQPAPQDALYLRAAQRIATRQVVTQQVQYNPAEIEGPDLQTLPLEPASRGLRRVRIFPRSAVPFNVESRESTATTPPEQIIILSGGVNIVVDGIEATFGNQPVGTVDLSADRIVIWTQLPNAGGDLSENVQTAETPFQVYMEGNVVVRQGTNFTRATQGFFDVRESRALLEKAELKTRIPMLGTAVRVRADRLRQLSEQTFQAQRAWVSTSEFGKPGYRLQMSDVFIEPRPADGWIGSSGPTIDAETGEPIEVPTTPWATALNNTFYVGNVPIFYFPYMSFPAEDPNIPLRTIRFANDKVFGTQLYTTFNGFKLLGIDQQANTRWDLHFDYLSKRGPEIGTSGNYSGTDRFGLKGPYQGFGLAYFINDTGLDNLGLDRLALIPQQEARGRALIRDRQQLPEVFGRPIEGLALNSEFAFLSDRNYLEEYAEAEYDAGKDYETLMQLRQGKDNWTWSVIGRPRLYDYFNETQWLPRVDGTILGQPLFGGLLNVSNHAYAGYANQHIAAPPSDPQDLYSVLPFEGNGKGLVFSERGEIDAPFQLGPIKFEPYVMGDFTHYGDDYLLPAGSGTLDRLYGSAGSRASLEFWRTFPEVQSSIFNLSGLAHKMVFDADYYYASSNQALNITPIYNEFDDNAQEQFRRRLLYNTFGGTLPPQFEPRFYALRTGAAHTVSAPYGDLVGTQQVLRMGWRHRLQTKAGPINAQRIKNWMTLDLDATYFPNPDRDNFGQDFGLYSIRYNWFVGDRTTLSASNSWDTYPGAQKLWDVSVSSQRTTRMNVYLGLREIQGGGQLNSQIASASLNYTMSPKWIGTIGTAYNIQEEQNLGQTFTVTRVGADFLIHVGGMIDPLKKNVGVAFSVEPRFAPGMGNTGSSMGSLLGQQNTPRR